MLSIRDEQRFLAMLALYDAPIDGIAGAKTRAARDEFCLLEGIQSAQIAERLIDKINSMPVGFYATPADLPSAIKILCSHIYLDMPQTWAYIMATCEWETAGRNWPVVEYFWAATETIRLGHLKKQRYWPYYGRGLPQLTWDFNYLKYSKILNLDLMSEPDLVLDPQISLFIAVHGMATGTFTGRSITHYINQHAVDYVNARRTINGTDRAQEIAALAQKWEAFYVNQ